MTVEELNKIKAEASSSLELRLKKNGYKVFVGAGECGIAHGSRNILSAILDEVAKRGMSDTLVTQMGCIGECDYEPIVEVVSPNGQTSIYGNVTEDIAKEIVVEHISGGKVLDKYLLDNIKEDK